VQVPADAPPGSLVGVAQFARDARGPPLAVGRMAIDSNKVNQSVTKGKAVIVLHTWKDHLWSIGSKGEPPEAVSASAVGDQDAGVGDGRGADDGGDVGVDAPPGPGQDPVGDQPADVKDGPVADAEEKLTPEGIIPSSRLPF
jgi:translation initiation factor 2D